MVGHAVKVTSKVSSDNDDNEEDDDDAVDLSESPMKKWKGEGKLVEFCRRIGEDGVRSLIDALVINGEGEEAVRLTSKIVCVVLGSLGDIKGVFTYLIRAVLSGRGGERLVKLATMVLKSGIVVEGDVQGLREWSLKRLAERVDRGGGEDMMIEKVLDVLVVTNEEEPDFEKNTLISLRHGKIKTEAFAEVMSLKNRGEIGRGREERRTGGAKRRPFTTAAQ